ncbi:three-Cys-motif partner protein [Kutzneria viridogrisea]|uniref:Three-Cys-motif partner protein n=1 Tax=Kutzneria viridogrisea TaxID=47990 RepID=A0ABR6BIX1_9PSEU|nr:three-Cys-motif partner protein [Kutzneria viridogrisea]
MPVDGPVPWERAEHTGAKHDIYRRYLKRWFPILLGGARNAYPSATYAEGFAGPGVYAGGEPGSPIIAMQTLLQTVSSESPVVRFLFVDDDPRCIRSLNEQFVAAFPTRPRAHDTTPVVIVDGTCTDQLEPQLDKIGAWGQPILAVLDSWGNVPISYQLLKRLAGNPATEVIVTLGPQSFIRFVSTLGPAADDVFGGAATWRQIEHMTDGAAKRQHVLTCYRQTLATAGFTFLLDFELIDRRGESLYLVFGTNHVRGLEKMKDALWEVDPVYGVGFRDPRDEQSEALFNFTDPHLAPLSRLLLREIQRGPAQGARVHDLRQFALHQTAFRPEHVIRALTPLRDQGSIQADTPGAIRIKTMVRAAAER